MESQEKESLLAWPNVDSGDSMCGIVAHDAGGAEIISSYVLKNKLNCKFCLEGPAVEIFRNKIGNITVSPLETLILESDLVICGTSWNSDLENRAIRNARQKGKISIAFLDHWVNYADRFNKCGQLCLPDHIWVGDPHAEILARREFPTVPVRRVGNPYLENIISEIKGLEARDDNENGQSFLYLCEPIREHSLKLCDNELYFGYTEEDAIKFFLSNLHRLGLRVNRILVRLHPSEPRKKYNWLVSEFNLPIDIQQHGNLASAINVADVVFGCESMAMVVALMAGKRVISCIPPGGRPCSLPFAEIEQLQLIGQMKMVKKLSE